MPLHTEARIQGLCSEAIAAEDESDVERIVSELRGAITEHIRCARASLVVQASLFANRTKQEKEDDLFLHSILTRQIAA
jgi:hypothetical protein